MIRSMRQEIIQRRNYLNNKIVSSIYFGGGTPSILSPIEIKKFINCLLYTSPSPRDKRQSRMPSSA